MQIGSWEVGITSSKHNTLEKVNYVFVAGCKGTSPPPSHYYILNLRSFHSGMWGMDEFSPPSHVSLWFNVILCEIDYGMGFTSFL